MNVADVWDFLSFLMTILLKPILTHFVLKVHEPPPPPGSPPLRDPALETFLDTVEYDRFNVLSKTFQQT